MANVRSAALTHPGRQRPNNEDFITFFEPIDPDVLQKSGSIYILADGVGGASKGERASQYAAQKILHDYYKYAEIPVDDRLRTIIRQAGNDIFDYAQSQDNYMQMATTVVVAVVRDSTLQVAHVGDSRAYLIHDGQVVQLTRDHTTVGEMMRDGLLNEEEAMHFDGRNPLSRSLGGQRDVPVDVTEPIQFIQGDKILLSSDGLTRYATRKNINDLLNQGEPDDVVYRMIDYANQSGGADNVSVIIVEAVDKAGAPTAPKGQKPIPVDWETIPTLPQNFVYREKSQRKKTTYARKKQPVKLPYLLAGFGIVLLILTGLFVANQLMTRFFSPTSDEDESIIVEETQSTPDVIQTDPGLVVTEVLNITSTSTNSDLLASPTAGEGLLVTEEISTEPTTELEIVVTESPLITPTFGTDQTGWCIYTVNFTKLNEQCIEHNAVGGCKNSYPIDPSWKNMDIICLIKCKFPQKYNQWTNIEIEGVDYLMTIIPENTSRSIEHGEILKFPGITRNNCESAGGLFEPDQ